MDFDRATSLFCCALAAGIGALLACGGEPQTPKEQIRSMLAEAEAYAEARDAGDLKSLVSEEYTDRFGHDREGIGGLFAFHFLRHDSIHLLIRVDRIEILEPASARVVAFVGMGGTDRSAPDVFLEVSADLYRVELMLVQEPSGDWKMIEADWRPARADDLSEAVSPPA